MPALSAMLAQRLFKGAADDVHADLLVAASSPILSRTGDDADQGDAAAGDDAFFDRRAGRGRASSKRCFFSFSSVSVAAPTLITATPPASFASRSCSFSRS